MTGKWAGQGSRPRHISTWLQRENKRLIHLGLHSHEWLGQLLTPDWKSWTFSWLIIYAFSSQVIIPWLLVIKIMLKVYGFSHEVCNPTDCRLPCPSLSLGVCSNTCPLSQWRYLTHPLPPSSRCLQSFPASRSFPMSQLFASGGQSIRASASVLPMNIQGWCSLGLTGLIS